MCLKLYNLWLVIWNLHSIVFNLHWNFVNFWLVFRNKKYWTFSLYKYDTFVKFVNFKYFNFWINFSAFWTMLKLSQWNWCCHINIDGTVTAFIELWTIKIRWYLCSKMVKSFKRTCNHVWCFMHGLRLVHILAVHMCSDTVVVLSKLLPFSE